MPLVLRLKPYVLPPAQAVVRVYHLDESVYSLQSALGLLEDAVRDCACAEDPAAVECAYLLTTGETVGFCPDDHDAMSIMQELPGEVAR